tara:strand:- start:1094 stop:1342 length:249 start_codon:yes stop_codon:yes gene_type:complete
MMTLKTQSLSKPIYGKELIQEVENNIDPSIFFDFLKSYKELTEQLKDVKDGFKTSPHNLLMDYLQFAIVEQRNQQDQDRVGV